MAETIKIGGELESTATGNKVADVANIKDKTKGNKSQAQINAELETALNDRYTKSETYNKTELNNMITTPNQQYVSVTANSQTTAVTDVLPATGAANTIYRIGNWDGGQFDVSVYSEYAWNGSQYVHLSTKTQIGEVFDISAYHATGGTLATYADLSAALDSNNGGGVPQSLQKGGMSVKFVHTSDNKYVQYRYMSSSTAVADFTNVANWQGVDDEPTAGSDNLVKSGGVFSDINTIKGFDDVEMYDYGRQKRAYIYGHFKVGDKVDLSITGTAVLISPYVVVRYDDESTNIANMNIGDSTVVTLTQDTEYIIFLLNKINIQTEGTIVCHAKYGNTLTIEQLQEGLETAEDNITNVDNELSQLDKDIYGEVEYRPVALELITGYFRGNAAGKVSDHLTERADTSCIRIDAESGEKYKIFGRGTNDIKLYMFSDASDNILLCNNESVNSRTDGLDLTAPNGTVYLDINFYQYDSSTDKLQKIVVEEGIQQELETTIEAVDELETTVEDVKNYIDKQPLKNKKILAFGDSITEFKYTSGDRKGWVDHAAEILGCEFVNAAIGGSHMNDRFDTELFDPTHEYAVNSYVFHKPDTTMNLYKCINAHTGAWNANDFEDVSETNLIGNVAYAPIFCYRMIKAFCNISVQDPYERFRDQIAAAECIYTWKSSHDDNRAIIQALVDTDPSEVDAIIIAEGTNDYNAVSTRGTSGSTDKTTTIGAINESLRLICQTFKSVPVFFVTPPVRWWNWSNGSGNIADFSDNYLAGGTGDITLKEWVEVLKNEYKLNHIPACDLYNELCWNQYNFTNYFPDNDGTHPRPGFKNIGAKVASFLIAHNVIK